MQASTFRAKPAVSWSSPASSSIVQSARCRSLLTNLSNLSGEPSVCSGAETSESGVPDEVSQPLDLGAAVT